MAGTITILIWAKPTAALTPPRQQERRSGQRGGKALGSIAKSGKSAIVEVLSGAASDQTRPHLRRNPASDFVCGTQQVASGITVQVFTTGRGTPYGLMAVPVIKMATRTELANRWYDLMDINAGTIATGEETIEDVGRKLFEFILDVASGRKNLLRSMGSAQPAGGI